MVGQGREDFLAAEVDAVDPPSSLVGGRVDLVPRVAEKVSLGEELRTGGDSSATAGVSLAGNAVIDTHTCARTRCRPDRLDVNLIRHRPVVLLATPPGEQLGRGSHRD